MFASSTACLELEPKLGMHVIVIIHELKLTDDNYIRFEMRIMCKSHHAFVGATGCACGPSVSDMMEENNT